MRRFLLIFTVLSVHGWSQSAQPAQPPTWTRRVNLTVGGEELPMTLTKSYASRELRALGDIVVSDDSPDYHLGLVVLSTVGGYAISVVTEQFSNIKPHLKPETPAATVSWMQTYSLLTGHWLVICPPSELDAAIKEVVANFDVHNLQPSRDAWQKFFNPQK